MSDLIRQAIGAGGAATLPGGRFFKLILAPSPVDIVFDFGGATKRLAAIDAGYSFGPLQEGGAFRKITIQSAAAQTIAAFVGEDAEDFDRVVGVVQVFKPVTIADAADVVVGAAAVTLLAPLNAARRAIHLVNIGANPIRMGNVATVGATRGARVDAGQSFTFETTSAIHGFSPLGTTIAVTEETD